MIVLEFLISLDTLRKLPVDILKIVNKYANPCSSCPNASEGISCLGCEEEQENLCEACIFPCESCGAPYCKGHISECEYCGEFVCGECVHSCGPRARYYTRKYEEEEDERAKRRRKD